MNEGIHSSLAAAMATSPTFPTTQHQPNTTQARPTVLLPHEDSGPLCLNEDGISTYYSTIPPGLGRVYMLHPLRYIQPAGDFYFIQHPKTRYPQIKSGLYCCHCFTLHPRGQSCPQPCSNPCGVCNGIHPPGLFCNLCYNTLTSWARKGIDINEHIAPATGTFQPTMPQFAVLQANGYIDPIQIYNPFEVPRFASQAPLDGRQSTPHPFIFSGPPPPPRQTQTAPMPRRYPPQRQQHNSGGYNGFGGHGYDNMADWHDYTGNMPPPQPFVQHGQSSFNQWQGPHNPYMQPYMPTPNSWYGQPSPYMQAPQSNPNSWYGQPNMYMQAAQPMAPRSVSPPPMAPPPAPYTPMPAPSTVAPSRPVSPTASIASHASVASQIPASPHINVTYNVGTPPFADPSWKTQKPNNGFARSKRHGGKKDTGKGKGNGQSTQFAGVRKPKSDKPEISRRFNRDGLRGRALMDDVNETLAVQDQTPAAKWLGPPPTQQQQPTEEAPMEDVPANRWLGPPQTQQQQPTEEASRKDVPANRWL